MSLKLLLSLLYVFLIFDCNERLVRSIGLGFCELPRSLRIFLLRGPRATGGAGRERIKRERWQGGGVCAVLKVLALALN